MRAAFSAFSFAASGALRAWVTTPMSISAWSGSAVMTASPLAVTEGGRFLISFCCDRAAVEAKVPVRLR
jgi:hypothetical protein